MLARLHPAVSAPFSAIVTIAAFVLPETILGMIEPSMNSARYCASLSGGTGARLCHHQRIPLCDNHRVRGCEVGRERITGRHHAATESQSPSLVNREMSYPAACGRHVCCG